MRCGLERRIQSASNQLSNVMQTVSRKQSSLLNITAVTLIVTSVIIRGGNRGVALILLEIVGLVAIAVLAWQLLSNRLPHTSIKKSWWVAVGLPCFILTIQSINNQSLPSVAAQFALLSLIPCIALFGFSLICEERESRMLFKTWVFVAVVQAVFGLIQLPTGSSLFFGIVTSEPVIGTFASKNTYANLLVMAIPLAVLLFFSDLSHHREPNRRTVWAWGAAVFTLMATIFLTTSRTGIVTGILTLFLSVVLLRPRSSEVSRGPIWWFAGTAALILAVLIFGGLDWVVRFDSSRLSTDYDTRALMRAATVDGILAQLPFGSGLGSYPWVSSSIQPREMGRYWLDLAHNDYLQLLMETGVLGGGLIMLIFWLYISRWWGLLRTSGGQWSRQRQVGVACGISLLAFALHAWVDYPFHIPANAMMAATLFGLMLRERSDGQPVKGVSRRVSQPISG
jgi:O-antigen ligase